MIIPPWSPKAKKPCRTCPFHKEARNTLLLGVACVFSVSSAVSWALAERYSDWKHDQQCPSVDLRELAKPPV